MRQLVVILDDEESQATEFGKVASGIGAMVHWLPASECGMSWNLVANAERIGLFKGDRFFDLAGDDACFYWRAAFHQKYSRETPTRPRNIRTRGGYSPENGFEFL